LKSETDPLGASAAGDALYTAGVCLEPLQGRNVSSTRHALSCTPQAAVVASTSPASVSASAVAVKAAHMPQSIAWASGAETTSGRSGQVAVRTTARSSVASSSEP
jgi:hypothetical protein